MCHDETLEKETVETAQWHTRKEIDRVMLASQVLGGFSLF